VALLALVVAGLPRRRPARVVTSAALLAGAAGLLLTLAFDKPLQPRYLLPVVPLVYLCAAAALGRNRVLAVAGACALLAGFVPFWGRYYVDYRRADYSDVTRRIETLERPDDYVLLTGPWQARYFDHYYAGRLFHTVLPRNAPPAVDPAEARARLEDVTATHRRLWFIQAGTQQADPSNVVERWLLRNAWPAFREAHQNAVLWLFAVVPPAHTAPLRPTAFGDVLRLTGGWVDAGDVEADDVLRLSLDFVVSGHAATDYKASLRMVGLDGQRTSVDFDLLDRGAESETPLPDWTPGQTVTIRRALWVPPEFSPQPYDLRLVVYDPATLAPLRPRPLDEREPFATRASCERAGCEAPIGGAYVTQGRAARDAPAAHYEPVAHRPTGLDEPDPIDLAGVRWRQSDPAAGPLDFDLVWRLNQRTAPERRSMVGVVGKGGWVWLLDTRPLFGGTFNIHDWRTNEAIGERRTADLSALPPGHYQLMAGMEDAEGHQLTVNGYPGWVELARFDLPYRPPLGERILRRLERFRLPYVLGLRW
jgi:hypothetical protein